jgi:hypothetical protein
MPTPTTTDSVAYVSQAKQYLAIRAKDRILVLNSTGKLESSFTIPGGFRDARAFMFCLLSNDSAILDVPTTDSRSLTPQAVWQWQLMWIDTQGNILRQKEYGLKRGNFADNLKLLPWHAALAVPAPLGIAAASTVVAPWSSMAIGEDTTYPSALTRSWLDFWPATIVIGLLGVILAGLCCRRQRNYGLPWTRTWTVFVFLLGLPGYVAYRTHRAWPARLPCPNCGQKVPRDRPACFACGKDFSAPALKGIEVFGG